MDAGGFDALTRSLASGASRRRVFGAVAAAVLAVSRPRATGADACKPADKPCKKDAQCCTGYCVPETGLCGCNAHADCDDRNGCTLDLCGPVSHMCFHLALDGGCVECRSHAHCANGGPCCGGRCCAPGAACSVNEQGLPVCCPTCENGQACCDVISFEPTGGGYVIDLGICVGAGQFEGYPSFCCPGGTGGYGQDPDTGAVFVVCSSPVGTVF